MMNTALNGALTGAARRIEEGNYCLVGLAREIEQKGRERIVENLRRCIERLMQRLLNRNCLCRYTPASFLQGNFS
jgi:hypothetical protein